MGGSGGRERGGRKRNSYLRSPQHQPGPSSRDKRDTNASPEAATEGDGNRAPGGPRTSGAPTPPRLRRSLRVPGSRHAAGLRSGYDLPGSLFPGSAEPTGPSRQLTHPVRPNTARNPFGAARAPWHLCQCQSSTRTRRRDCAPLANQTGRKARPGAHN